MQDSPGQRGTFSVNLPNSALAGGRFQPTEGPAQSLVQLTNFKCLGKPGNICWRQTSALQVDNCFPGSLPLQV